MTDRPRSLAAGKSTAAARLCAALRGTMVGALLLLPLLFAHTGARAQTSAAPDPEAMARAALGDERGWAGVAVWRNGTLAQATVRRASDSAAAERVPVSGPAPLFEIGSVSKLFTGLLLAQAVERGELKLEATVGELLQGEVTLASPRVAAITLRQLITHTSCLPRQFTERPGASAVAQIRNTDRVDLIMALARQSLDTDGPCPARYSNFGLALVGELLAWRNNSTWENLVLERIARPLGLRDTLQQLGVQQDRLVPAFNGLQAAEPWAMKAFAGAGGLRSSAQDLVAFGRALLAGRNGPLGAAAERMLTPLERYGGREIGFAVFIHGPVQRRSYSHDGLTGGYRALLTLAADTGEVMAVLASNAQAPLGAMAQDWWAQRYPVPEQAIAIDPAVLAPLTGVYADDQDLRLYVVSDGHQLFVRSRGGVFRAYRPVAVDSFSRPAGGARIGFERDSAGAVQAVVLEQSGNRVRAARQPLPAPGAEVLAPGRASDYTGRFAVAATGAAAVVFDVRAEAGQLLVRSTRVPWEPVFPLADRSDRFRYDVPDAQLQFERDASGKVVALVLHQRGELRALRVGTPR